MADPTIDIGDINVADEPVAEVTPTEALAARILVNPEAMHTMGTNLAKKFTVYEADRKQAELKWARNARQFLGIYDPEVERALDANRSRAYPKLTRVKVVSMLSRLMNLLFQADDKCWGAEPSPVPDLSAADLQTVLDTFQEVAASGEVDTDAIEEAIREFAKVRAIKLELEIEDQLSELGGSTAASFVQLCRKVLYSGILYGMGVVKGPFTATQTRRTWSTDTDGKLISAEEEVFRPRFEFVAIWDYYPDMSAKYLHQMEGQFERHVMSKHQVVMLKERPDFISGQIDKVLEENPTGNYTPKTFETELKAMGVQQQVTSQGRNKFEALAYEGYVSGRELSDAGVDVPEALQYADVRANVWFMGNIVIKAELNAWSALEPEGEVPMYHHFIFEEDESSLLGNGLPNIMRDSQMNMAASVRMMIDNGSVMRNLEINTSLLSIGQDMTSIDPDKVWFREDDSPATIATPAVRVIDFPIRVAELKTMAEMFQSFSDAETFVNPSTGGDMQKGPSEPFRTASGASMIQGSAALPFKDVVRNFDRFSESVVGSLIAFNKHFNTNPEVRGDFRAVSKGATSLIAKEVLGTQLDNFASTLTEGERPYVNMRNLVRARARVRDMSVGEIVVTDAEADRIDADIAKRAAEASAIQQKTSEAQVREILANTLKAISQAGKNTAAADATAANLILDALEKGVPLESIVKSIAAGQNTSGGGATPGGEEQQAGDGVAGAAEVDGVTADQSQRQTPAMPTRPVSSGPS